MQTASFTLEQVSGQRAAEGRAWLEFLDRPALSMGIYHVAAGTNDRETHDPHDRDEVYVGISGRGRLVADGQVFEISEGTIVYVKAGVEHHFFDVEEDLSLLVLFAGAADQGPAG